MSKILEFEPKCVNKGCGRQSGHDGKRWRPLCNSCHKAGLGKSMYRAGVIPFKTGKCSNISGHLGFKCLINWKNVPAWAKGMTEIDHKDGNPLNNKHSNLQELCPMCHKVKGQMNGDYNGYRKVKKAA